MATKTTKTTDTEQQQTPQQPLDEETRAKLAEAGYTVVRKAQREPRAPRTEKECRDHATNFPDEEPVRPIAEFGVATGSLCKRCYKLAQKAKRAEFRKDHPTLRQWADELAAYVEALTDTGRLNEKEQAQATGLLARNPHDA